MRSTARAAGLPLSGGRSPSSRGHRLWAKPGITLIELSIVIFALILFATLLLTGARGWKRGSDRANCIVNINSVQKGVRGFANMSGYNPGDTVPGLEALVVGPGTFFEALPNCPGGGNYTLGGNLIPPVGSVYMKCSLESIDDHLPPAVEGW